MASSQKDGKDDLAPLPIPQKGDPDFSNVEKATELVEHVNACTEMKVIPETAGKVHKSKAGLAIEIFAPGSSAPAGTTTTLIGAKYDPSTGNATGIQFDAVITNISTYSG